MRKYYIMFLFLFRNGISDIYAQEIPLKHKIAKGETIEFIAKKYAVSPAFIYELNPSLISGFKENDVILISKGSTTLSNDSSTIINHIVQPNETKYGLSKKYNISIPELERQNPHIISMLKKGHELKIQSKVTSKIEQNSDNSSNHVVVKGETLWELSRRYKVTVNQIVTENKINVAAFLQIGQILKIPVSSGVQKPIDSNEMQFYLVESGETKYGLSKRFKISINELEQLNPHIVVMLKKGHQIKIPRKNIDEPTQTINVGEVKITENTPTKNQEYNTHIVVAGETKFEISKKYNTTVEQLEKINPQIVDMLRTGQEINVPKMPLLTTEVETEVVKNEVSSQKEQENKQDVSVSNTKEAPKNLNEATDLVTYEVMPQETLYGLSKMMELTSEKLIEINPELVNGLKTGMLLRIPIENSLNLKKAKENLAVISQAGLLKSMQKGVTKEIAFLMPFTQEKYLDILKTAKKNGKSTTAFSEFYAGAALAVDSLLKSGVSIKTRIINVDDLKPVGGTFSDLVKKNIQNASLVLCPSMEYYSEEIRNYLVEYKLPFIISDTILEDGSGTNTFTTSTSDKQLRKLILDYITTQNENLIIVSAPKRIENRNFITKNYPQAKFAKISETGILDSESLRNLLSTTKRNYVVLDSDKSGLILETTTILLKESAGLDIQLALLEPKENVIGAGLSEMRFRALKMIYPSSFNPNETKQIVQFKKDFVNKYGFQPTKEAVVGFDVTFDAMLRHFQEKEFKIIAKESATEHLFLRFKYLNNLDKGFFNSGGYILKFDEQSNTVIIN